jgi:hypothetical protein
MADRCTVHRLPVDKLEDAAGDPALAALMGEGWEVLASVVVDEGRGPTLHLLLRPPRPDAGEPALGSAGASPAWAWALLWALCGVLLGGAVAVAGMVVW